MEYISKVTAYDVPFEKSSNDRVIEDVDNKINAFPKLEVSEDNFTYDISTTTNAEFTLNAPRRYNYLRIESKLFPNQPVSYWFLTHVKDVESDTGTRYNAKLDVIATFGMDLFAQMNDKDIEIERMHGERYVLENGKMIVNKEHHSLINSDFKVKDTAGTKIKYWGKDYDTKQDHFNVGQIRYNVPNVTPDVVDERIGGYILAYLNTYQSKDYKQKLFGYAVCAGPSLRKYLWGDADIKVIYDKTKKDGVNSKYSLMESWIKANNVKHSDIYVLPILKGANRTATSTKYLGNTLEWLQQQLPEGTVLSVVYTNVPLKYGEFTTEHTTLPATKIRGIELFYKDIAKVVTYDSVYFPAVTLDDNVTIVTPDELRAKYKDIYNVLGEVPKGVANAEELYEIGITNNNITQSSMISMDHELDLDMHNYWKGITMYHDLCETGYAQKFKIGETFSTINLQKEMSYFTDQGKSYTATHKASIEAQKKRIDLETAVKVKENRLSRTQTYGGGIVGGAMSMINPMNWGSNVINDQILDANKDLANGKKAEIDAQITDMKSTPSYAHVAKEGSNSLFLNDQYGITFKAEIPNGIILKKIIKHYKDFATPFKSVTDFTSDTWSNMETFNYLKLMRAKDYVTATDVIDSDVIEEFDHELTNGIRIWHKPTFNRSDRNLEKSLVNFLALPRKK